MDHLTVLPQISFHFSRIRTFKNLELVYSSVAQLVLKLAHPSDFRFPLLTDHRCRP